uniref:Synaptopodin 2 n=1 Tax=Tetraodon nigroviridis TaxID=99883 RepID=H3D179_TETNG
MGIGDYMCVTLRGGAPWGFTLKEGEGETYRPFLVSQVEEGGRASLAGVRDGDEMVSLNGEPCADLTLSQALEVMHTSADCLQLLFKRYCTVSAEEEEESEDMCSGQDSEATLESTTLHIFSSDQRCQSPKELCMSEAQGEPYCGLNSDEAVSKLVCTELRVSSPADQGGQEPDEERCFSPGEMVELQVSLSKQTSSDLGSTSLGSALGILGEPSGREAAEMVHKSTTGVLRLEPGALRNPLKQLGVVLSPPTVLGQGDGLVGHPARSEEGDPQSFSVSFGIPSDEVTPAEEQDSDSEGEQDKPHKHHARHARLRRCESLSEKQVKEAKSKCKRIALLLTAAPSNPNNKGVLMFKKHRQRAKKYTLVSYGTGEDEPESKRCTVELTLVATSHSEIDKQFQTNIHNSKSVLAVSLDKGLLEIERNLNNREEMECLPETKGKGALMFAQRRQRMDEIAAEHEELRRHGIPVEGIQEAEKNLAENSYMQSTAESHIYMDVNAQEYHQEQQMQHYSTNINGTVQQQTSEMQHTFSNRTAKPFSVENMAAVPYSPAVSGCNQDSFGQGEQIASRDERIATPAIKTGVLMEGRKRNTGKPMFTFKECPKVSPNPALLNLLNKSDKKLGLESGPEEDYLSLGAEACNFLQSSLKHKNPPPVAPKPVSTQAQPSAQPEANVNPWAPPSAQAQPQPPWAQSSAERAQQPAPANISTSLVNTRPSPKPWTPPQTHTHPPPPQRMHSFTIGHRASSPINPMATVLNPSSQSPSLNMPAVRGKGADMFVKRQSRMEKFVVDSETVEANKASRSTSPAASLPNEWKYTPNVRAPPSRAYNPIQSPFYPPAATKQPPSSSPSVKAKNKGKQKETPPKPLSVVDVMRHQPYQLSSSLFIFGPGTEANKSSAPKPAPSLPKPPAEDQAVRYEQMPRVQADGPYSQPACANSPPYLATPSVALQPQAPGSYVAPNVAVAAKAESVSGGNAAPKPKFTAKKSSAQIWKPTAVDK